MDALATISRPRWYFQKLLEGASRKQIRHLRFGLHVVRTSTSGRFEFIPLGKLLPNHQLDREKARQVFRARVEKLKPLACDVRERITHAEHSDWMPSGNPMLAIRGRDGSYRVFEGNGRLHALHAVFGHRPELLIEVKVFEPRSEHTLDRLEALSEPFALPAF